jgi:AcrR family transcriptional regulator
MQYLSQRLAVESTRTRDGERPRGPVAASQRERILAAAEQLIAERGCGGTTIEAIVKLAKVSSVTFYEHFADKEACFVAAFERAASETRERLGEVAPPELGWEAQVRRGIATLLALIEAKPARARMCLVEAAMGGPALRIRYEATLDIAAAKLREGRAFAGTAELSETAEEAAVGGLAWLLRERLELERGRGVRELAPRMTEIALSPYLGGSEAVLTTAPPAAAPGNG